MNFLLLPLKDLIMVLRCLIILLVDSDIPHIHTLLPSLIKLFLRVPLGVGQYITAKLRILLSILNPLSQPLFHDLLMVFRVTLLNPA